MVDRLAAIWQFLLDIRLTNTQNERIRKGLISYWTKNDRKSIDLTLAKRKYFGQKEELTALRESSQEVLVESMWRDQDDAVSTVLLEAFDSAHPDKKAATRASGFSDLVGLWKRQDGVLANRGVGGQLVGVMYTDSGTLQITAGGQFRHVQAHNHCSGSTRCCRIYGSTESGAISVEGSKLILESKLPARWSRKIARHPRTCKARARRARIRSRCRCGPATLAAKRNRSVGTPVLTRLFAMRGSRALAG